MDRSSILRASTSFCEGFLRARGKPFSLSFPYSPPINMFARKACCDRAKGSFFLSAGAPCRRRRAFDGGAGAGRMAFLCRPRSKTVEQRSEYSFHC